MTKSEFLSHKYICCYLDEHKVTLRNILTSKRFELKILDVIMHNVGSFIGIAGFKYANSIISIDEFNSVCINKKCIESEGMLVSPNKVLYSSEYLYLSLDRSDKVFTCRFGNSDNGEDTFIVTEEGSELLINGVVVARCNSEFILSDFVTTKQGYVVGFTDFDILVTKGGCILFGIGGKGLRFVCMLQPYSVLLQRSLGGML